IDRAHSKGLQQIGKRKKNTITSSERILTANRLFMIDELKKIRKKCKKILIALLYAASKFQKVPFKRSTLGHFLLGITESLMDDMDLLDFAGAHINKNPLGSVDGYGSIHLLPRELTTQELGFKKIQINSLYCRYSSVKFTNLYLNTLAQISESLRKLNTQFSSQKQKKRIRKIPQGNTIKNASAIMSENLQSAKTILKNLIRKIRNSEIPKTLDPKFKTIISLGAAGNLDLDYYRTRLGKI
ncbi:hypothetical protein HYW82_04365, partial [Candidatus Peregrinibacteria bacterium]|nr:hypothetical protein [Candidatus Peregrinibacteria bacterium]